MSELVTPFEALRSLVAELDAELMRLVEAGHVDWNEKQLPDDIRARLLIAGSSMDDYVFWVRHKPQDGDLSDSPESQMFWAEEMEAGTGAWGVNAREALDHYLSDDILDRRRWTDHRGLDTRYPDAD